MNNPKYAGYQSPFSGRYASAEMLHLFSAERKFQTWRQIWIALAEAEMELGLPVSKEQIAELKKNAKDINFELAEAKEKELRHDVMAHIHAYGEQCSKARSIIHLGATSCTVTDNADLIIFREGLQLLAVGIANVLDQLSKFAKEHRELTTLAFTHLQPAQCTTVGKRATLWSQELLFDLREIESLIESLPCLGAKGTTGTQASFLRLFDGDHKKVKELDRKFADKLGFKKSLAVSGQTYPRKIDDHIVSILSRIAQSAAKFGSDIRILSHRREIEEPFGDSQVGSSAMPYKQNPMLCERMTALARYVMSLPNNTSATAAQQWFERTLDDSANRRIVMAEGFLATDSILLIYLKVAAGLRVYPAVIQRNVEAELPFMATEELLMEAVKAGGDRQELHEQIRVHSIAAAKRIKVEGKDNDLLERLKKDKNFSKVIQRLPHLIEPHAYSGRAAEQVNDFLQEELEPALRPYKKSLGKKGEVRV